MDIHCFNKFEKKNKQPNNEYPYCLYIKENAKDTRTILNMLK